MQVWIGSLIDGVVFVCSNCLDLFGLSLPDREQTINSLRHVLRRTTTVVKLSSWAHTNKQITTTTTAIIIIMHSNKGSCIDLFPEIANYYLIV